MGFFASIYNKVANFFSSQDATDSDASKTVASSRLKLVLMQDRTNLTPKILEQMRSELVNLLSKYLEMDNELLELNFEQEGDQVALMLSIPVIRAKDEEEIEAILAAEQENSEETDDDQDDEETAEEVAETESSIDESTEDSNEENSEEDEIEEDVVEYFDEEEEKDSTEKTPVKHTKTKKVTTPNPFKAEEENKNNEVSVES